jgi:hypothetical protein
MKGTISSLLALVELDVNTIPGSSSEQTVMSCGFLDDLYCILSALTGQLISSIDSIGAKERVRADVWPSWKNSIFLR